MKVCVSCQKDVEGKPATRIREDRIIRGIRRIKQALGVAQNNELFVCSDCMPKHMERRKSFEKSMLFASVFAGLILIVLLAAFVLSGRFDLWAVVSAFIVAIFILALPVFKYTPAVEGVSALKLAPAAQQAAPAKEAAAPPPGAAAPAKEEEAGQPKEAKERKTRKKR